ncbi:cysteine--tRNA ligase [Buchnera aphidicola]|uniref:cysteine--tRNA ligase n=1 Tax=Buchnera aphidicola TaxID=9 RepID=UPI003464C96C
MLKIFNSLTKKKEYFKPIISNKVGMYVCGVTTYDFCHIGHGRTFIIFDVIARYLRYCGYQLKYVRNITDIDDKIINASYQRKECINIFTNRMIKYMNQDFKLLNILSPDVEPKVTEYITVIIDMIAELLKLHHAYISQDGNVIFSVKSDINYGMLSKQSLSFLQFSDKIKKINTIKKNTLDFVLWKTSKNNEPYWNSPWGRGRPGWHIECSAISRSILGNTFDIHGGGADLLFPHHENERSQSMCVNQRIYANYWIHAGLVNINNKKMSKSSDNFYILRDILKNYDSEILRYYFLSTHYRHPLYFSEENLKKSSCSLIRLYRALQNTNFSDRIIYNSIFELEFKKAMDDDFNTPMVFSIFLKLANRINILKKEKNTMQINKFASILKSLGEKLGLLLHNPSDFLKNISNYTDKQIQEIEKLLEIRNIARKFKKWTTADNIRNYLLSLGVVIEDNQNETIWYDKKQS